VIAGSCQSVVPQRSAELQQHGCSSSYVDSSDSVGCKKYERSKLRNESLTREELTMMKMQGPQLFTESTTKSTNLSARSESASALASESPSIGPESLVGSDSQPLDIFPSVGSANHSAGRCHVCRFVHTPGGCDRGAACKFCHCMHDRKSKVRPSKATRDRYHKRYRDASPPTTRMDMLHRQFPTSSVEIGTQRRLAWPLRSDDTRKSRSVHKYERCVVQQQGDPPEVQQGEGERLQLQLQPACELVSEVTSPALRQRIRVDWKNRQYFRID